MMFSSSPRDVQSFLDRENLDDSRKDAPFLQDFLKDLPFAIRQRKKELLSHSSKDPITELFK